MEHDQIGRIESNGYVYDMESEYMGKVIDGKVFDKTGEYVGHVNDAGRVFDDEGEPIGIVGDDGIVRDDAETELGEVESPHMQFGGAAYLLLLR